MEEKTNGLTFEDFSPRGAFTKGILYMNLSFPIKENLSEYNIHDLGTLIHEYNSLSSKYKYTVGNV